MPTVAISIEASLFAALYDHAGDSIDTVVFNVLDEYLERVSDSQSRSAPGKPVRGRNWQGVLLPFGTELGTKYFQSFEVATTTEAGFEWNGQTFLSVAQLCNAMRGNTQNNAWKVMQVRLPGAEWRPAEALRRIR